MPWRPQDAHSWTTLKELRYIDSILTQKLRHDSNRTNIDPIAILRGYITGSLERDNWGSMNWREVLTHACQLYNRQVDHNFISETRVIERGEKRWKNNLKANKQ